MTMQNRNFELPEYKLAFQRFNRENGHFPSFHEIESCDYLPSARTIQRQFGSLKKLRKAIGLEKSEIDLRSSATKNQKHKETRQKAQETEREARRLLIDHYGQPYVHHNRIFLPDGRVAGLRFFYASNLANLPASLNWQLKKASKNELTRQFIICLNPAIEDVHINSRRTPIPDGIEVMSYNVFLERYQRNFLP